VQFRTKSAQSYTLFNYYKKKQHLFLYFYDFTITQNQQIDLRKKKNATFLPISDNY